MRVEDAELENSLIAAAAMAKEASQSSDGSVSDQVDIAARLVTSLAQLGKKRSKLQSMLQDNPQPDLDNAVYDVDSHIGFASACSKLTLQFRHSSAFSLSLHQLFANGGKANTEAEVLDAATKKVAEAIVLAVALS